MQKALTLKQNTEFHRAYGRGKVRTSPMLVTYVVKNRGQGVRLGITAAKKLGSAVERNRCRRIIRAAFSSISPFCSGNHDIVFVAKLKLEYCLVIPKGIYVDLEILIFVHQAVARFAYLLL